jgi:hypothetical protein
MRIRSLLVRSSRMLAGFAVAMAFIAVTPLQSSAATCIPWFGSQPPSVGATNNSLAGVATTSPCDAWAVGNYFAGGEQSYIQHWNGTAWTQVPNPNPGPNPTALSAVTAVSPSAAWAVGTYGNGGPGQTLIEHWDGKQWTQQTSPNPGGPSAGDNLNGVTATSATTAWAVGQTGAGDTLIERWNGISWKRVPSANGGTFSNPLFAVAANSSSNAWAVGNYDTNTATRTLIEHWTGTAWQKVTSPSPGSDSNLRAVAVTSDTDAWAVGWQSVGAGTTTLIEHWNGVAWKIVPGPSLGASATDPLLMGVAATSSSNAIAVGSVSIGSVNRTLVIRWNGKAWVRVASPNLTPHWNQLNAVAASSPANVWAVGLDYDDANVSLPLALHCC